MLDIVNFFFLYFSFNFVVAVTAVYFHMFYRNLLKPQIEWRNKKKKNYFIDQKPISINFVAFDYCLTIDVFRCCLSLCLIETHL